MLRVRGCRPSALSQLLNYGGPIMRLGPPGSHPVVVVGSLGGLVTEIESYRHDLLVSSDRAAVNCNSSLCNL